MSEGKKTIGIEKKAMSRIGVSERQNWYSIAFIWIGIMVCVPALMVGSILASAMSFREVVIASIIGYAILAVIMSFMSMISSDLGLPAAMAATKGYGDRGASYVSSIIFFVGSLGWFGVQTAACAAAFSVIMGYVGVNFPFWLGAIIWGALMVSTAVTGFSVMKWLNYLTVPFLLIVCAYGAIYGIGEAGSDHLFAWEPGAMPLTVGISITVGTMAVGAVISGDYARYAKARGHAVAASFCGVLPSGIFMFAIGAIMAISIGDYDIVRVFAGLGLPILSMIVLIIATWTTNMGNAYTAGLAAMKITGLKDKYRPVVTMIVGAVGIAFAISGIANALISFISIISAITPALAGVIIADYWIIGKGKPENWYRVKGVNWIGIISWIIGSVVALFFSFFAPALDSIIVAIIAYTVLFKILGHTSMGGQGKLPVPGEEGDENEKEAAA